MACHNICSSCFAPSHQSYLHWPSQTVSLQSLTLLLSCRAADPEIKMDRGLFNRPEDFKTRRPKQIKTPPFPTTSIGSFPQTAGEPPGGIKKWLGWQFRWLYRQASEGPDIGGVHSCCLSGVARQ